MKPSAGIFVWPALLLIVLVGAWLRFTHLDWDGLNQLHPDERAILFVASQMHAPATLAEALNASQSPVNPFRTSAGEARAYPYGHLPLYTALIARRLFSPLCRDCAASSEAAFTHLTYTVRAVSALSDTLWLIAVFLLARRLYGAASGLLAAAFGAFAVLHIQNAHFGTVDATLTLFVTLALWLLVRYAQDAHLRDSLLAGVCVGLAVGCKVTAVLLIVPLLAAHWEVRPLRQPQHLAYPILRDMPTFWLTILAAVVSFALTNPYAVLDPAPFFSAAIVQAQVISGGVDWPFTRQFAGTIPVWHYIDQQAKWFFGPLLTIVSYTGLGCAARRLLQERSRSLSVVLSWAAAMLLTIGAQYVKFPRYMMPLTAVLFSCAAGMLFGDLRAQRFSILRMVASAGVLLSTALYAFAFGEMYRTPHPWVAASRWIYRDLPAGTILISEVWDDPLPLDMLVGKIVYMRERSFDSRLIAPFGEPDDEAKLNTILDQVSGADYIILSSSRLYGVIPRLRDRYPLTAAYYQTLFSGALGYGFERSFSRSPELLGLALVDDPFLLTGLRDPRPPSPVPQINLGPADEAYTVYDHPLVLVFRNTARLTVEQMREAVLLEAQNR